MSPNGKRAARYFNMKRVSSGSSGPEYELGNSTSVKEANMRQFERRENLPNSDNRKILYY